MIWILMLLFAPVLAILYVVYLMIKAIIVLIAGFVYFLTGAGKTTIGELDPVTDKVTW